MVDFDSKVERLSYFITLFMSIFTIFLRLVVKIFHSKPQTTAKARGPMSVQSVCKRVNDFTMSFLQSELPSNGGRCRCRRSLWHRSCCGWWSGPDCGSSWRTSRPSPPSGCRGTPSASGELTLGPTWMVDLEERRSNATFYAFKFSWAIIGILSWHTVGLEFPWFTAAVSSLVYGPHNENVLGATLEPVDSVAILLDVWYNHPAVSRVAQTCSPDTQRVTDKEQTNRKIP